MHRREAFEWERYVDEAIGVHVRRCVYHVLLDDHRDLVIRWFAQGGPWYGPALLRLIYPKLRARMKQAMAIDARAARASKAQLAVALDRVWARLRERPYLVGEAFSRADLAAAALAAPLRLPPQYGLRCPPRIPPELERLLAEFRDTTEWVARRYEHHR